MSSLVGLRPFRQALQGYCTSCGVADQPKYKSQHVLSARQVIKKGIARRERLRF